MAVANVGIADYKIIKSPDQIMTVGLGSCCGVVIYDEINKIAGLVSSIPIPMGNVPLIALEWGERYRLPSGRIRNTNPLIVPVTPG